MYNSEYNYQEINFKTIYNDAEAELRFPYWNTNDVRVCVVAKEKEEITFLEENKNYKLSTPEESKKENRYVLKILEWPSSKVSEWIADETAYVYIRRYSEMVQNYDPYNYKTPSPQDISNEMDNIVGIIHDKYSELKDEIYDIDGVVTINLTRDTIPIYRDSDKRIISYDEAYTIWNIRDHLGKDVSDKYNCSYSSDEWIIVQNDTANRKIKVIYWSDSEKRTGTIQLTFTKIDDPTISFLKYVSVNIIDEAENGEAYVLTLISDNGDVFKPGTDTADTMKITLKAYIYLNGVDIGERATSSYNPYNDWHYYWYRKQIPDGTSMEWIKDGIGETITENYRELVISPEQVNFRANFTCIAQK